MSVLHLFTCADFLNSFLLKCFKLFLSFLHRAEYFMFFFYAVTKSWKYKRIVAEQNPCMICLKDSDVRVSVRNDLRAVMCNKLYLQRSAGKELYRVKTFFFFFTNRNALEFVMCFNIFRIIIKLV